MSIVLTVFGATGQQGGALIDFLLHHPELSKTLTLRGITRDITKPAAISLKKRGVEILQADLNDSTSVRKAIAGSYTVFGVTNHWDPAGIPDELAQGKRLADACLSEGVTQIIWSSLPHVTKMTGGKISTAKNYDDKAVVEEYIRGLNIKSMFFMPGWFMQNHLVLLKPQLDVNGTFTLTLPFEESSRIPLIDIRDIGKFILPALLEPEKYNRKSFTCATAFYTPVEMVDGWTKVTGTKVVFRKPDPELKSVHAALEKTEGLITEYSYFGPTGDDDLRWTLEQVIVKLTGWEEFVADNEPWFEN